MYRTFRLRVRALLWLMMIVLVILAVTVLPGTGAKLLLPGTEAKPLLPRAGVSFPVSLSADSGPADGVLPAERVIYLTFDDGPSKNTAAVLDVLKEEGVKATFFVIGAETERGTSLYRRIIDEGHAMGLHTYTHRYGEIYESADSYLEDIGKLSDHLEKTVGIRPKIFRFPGGSNNSTADGEVLAEIKKRAEKEGLCWFDWNALGKDDRSWVSDPWDICQSVIETGGEKKRIVVLMHDDGMRTTAAEAVSLIIDHYRELGYRFDVLTPETEPMRFP
ncbi:MAG: polysaccharide deacetylase [Oscillospiraceae bacterium]|nr:polysaccharide deacetylase [Oscillospiraceae bacterium]